MGDFTAANGISYAYGTDPGTVTAVAYNDATKDVVIPPTIDNGVPATSYAVTAIGARAFFNMGLTSISLPSGLVHIGSLAFAYSAFTSLDIPASVTGLGSSAFEGSSALTSVTLHDGLLDIGTNAFANAGLSSVDIPSSVTAVGTFAFYGNGLTSLTLHGGLTDIASYAFGNNLLETVDIPASVSTIGVQAFSRNVLTSVSIPASVTDLPAGVFKGNPLVSVTFSGAAPSIVGATEEDPSLGSDANLFVHYLSEFGDAAGATDGFTTPTWMDYHTVLDHMVSFNTGGRGSIDSQRVASDSLIDAPVAPVVSGWKLDGWFTDAAFTTPFDFLSAPTDDVTLFAQWTVVAPRLSLDLGMSVDDVAAGQTVTARGDGVPANSEYRIVVESTPTTIAFGSADSDGAFTADGVIPAGLAAGRHTVTLSAIDAEGTALALVAYFSINAAGVVTYLSYTEAEAVSVQAEAVSVSETAALAATGFDGAPFGAAALLLLAGAALVLSRRRNVV